MTDARQAAFEEWLAEWKWCTLLAMSPPRCLTCGKHPAASALGQCKSCAAERAA